MTDPVVDPEITGRLIQQTLDLWVQPEIEKRQKAGDAPSPFPLSSAQVIFDPDTEVVEVRLNEEVKVVGELELDSPVKEGDLLKIDPAKIKGLLLTDSDPNAGHITLFAFGPRFLVSFDLRRNAKRVEEHIQTAREFLETASAALDRRHLRAFCENLFSAVELLAKAILLTFPGREILESKKHTTIARRFNLWAGKLGNADPRYAELLNRLAQIRDSARYLRGEPNLGPTEPNEMLELAEGMYAFAGQNVQRVFVQEDAAEEDRGHPSE